MTMGKKEKLMAAQMFALLRIRVSRYWDLVLPKRRGGPLLANLVCETTTPEAVRRREAKGRSIIQ